MFPAQPIGMPSTQVLPAFSGKDEGPTHVMFRAYFVAEARKYRILMHKTSGDISKGYESRAQAAARFAAIHHRLGLIDIANAKTAKASERNLPEDERRGAFAGVRP
jgi:hypothetical protein